MSEFKRIVNNSSDYNRFTQQNGYNAKMYGGTSFYIAQKQAKKECVGKLKAMVSKWADGKAIPLRVRRKIESIESTIEGRCMNVKSQRTLEKWLDNDWDGLIKALGISNSVSKLKKVLHGLSR